MTHVFCFPPGVFRTILIFIFVNRDNLSRNKRLERAKETGTSLPTTPAPSYPDSFLTGVQFSPVYLFGDGLCIYKVDWCIHLPLDFLCKSEPVIRLVLHAFSPPFSLRDGCRQSVLILAATLYFFILFFSATLCSIV